MTIKEALAEASLAYASRNYQKAVPMFLEIYEKEEEHFMEGHSDARSTALYFYILCLFETNDYRTLCAFVSHYLEKHHPMTLMQKAKDMYICSCFELGNYKKAIEMENYTMKYNKYSELDGLTYKDLALSHLKEGHFEKAIEDFEEMYYNNYFHYGNNSEQVGEAAICLGWIYLKTGDIKRAVKFAIDAGESDEAQAIEIIGRNRWEVWSKQIPEVSGFLIQRFGEELYKTVFKDIAKG